MTPWFDQQMAGMVGGAIGTGVGVVAIVQDQPWWVWMAFMLPSVISAGVMGGLLPVVKGPYRQAEQRKLAAQNFRG